MIINMWSGPRNLSTALMRSFENRNDTEVWDEPLYAYYLKKTNLKHPMYKEIINSYKTSINELIIDMTKIKKTSKIFYIKQMTHHLLDNDPINWIKNSKNCLLIRNPSKVISSYIKKNKLKNASELGFKTQFKIYKYLKKNNLDIIIINADNLANDSEKTIKILCKKLNIKFSKKMISWAKGYRETDGIWSKIWYKKVITTNTFERENRVKKLIIPKKYSLILDECNKIYRNLDIYSINK